MARMQGPIVDEAGRDRARPPVERRRVSRPAFVLRFSFDAAFPTGGDSCAF